MPPYFLIVLGSRPPSRLFRKEVNAHEGHWCYRGLGGSAQHSCAAFHSQLLENGYKGPAIFFRPNQWRHWLFAGRKVIKSDEREHVLELSTPFSALCCIAIADTTMKTERTCSALVRGSWQGKTSQVLTKRIVLLSLFVSRHGEH